MIMIRSEKMFLALSLISFVHSTSLAMEQGVAGALARFGWTAECVEAYKGMRLIRRVCSCVVSEPADEKTAQAISALFHIDDEDEEMKGKIQALLNDPSTQACDRQSPFFGITPLHLAAAGGFCIDNEMVITSLIEAGANPDVLLDNPVSFCHGYAPLHFAAVCGNVGSIKALIKAGACVDAQVTNPGKFNHGLTPLHSLAMLGYVNSVKLLIEKGANPNALVDNPGFNFHGFTPLMCAVTCAPIPLRALSLDKSDWAGVVAALINAKANLNTRINNPGQSFHGFTPLRVALEAELGLKSLRLEGSGALQVLVQRGAIIPASLLDQLRDIGISEIPEKQIDKTL